MPSLRRPSMCPPASGSPARSPSCGTRIRAPVIRGLTGALTAGPLSRMASPRSLESVRAALAPRLWFSSFPDNSTVDCVIRRAGTRPGVDPRPMVAGSAGGMRQSIRSGSASGSLVSPAVATTRSP